MRATDSLLLHKIEGRPEMSWVTCLKDKITLYCSIPVQNTDMTVVFTPHLFHFQTITDDTGLSPQLQLPGDGSSGLR